MRKFGVTVLAAIGLLLGLVERSHAQASLMSSGAYWPAVTERPVLHALVSRAPASDPRRGG